MMPKPALVLRAATWFLVLVHADGEPFADWMMSLMRPDAPTHSCCGPSDQVYVDKYESDPDGGGFIAFVSGEDKPTHIPPEKIIWDRVNPTGRGVLFRTTAEWGETGFIYCFVPGTGV